MLKTGDICGILGRSLRCSACSQGADGRTGRNAYYRFPEAYIINHARFETCRFTRENVRPDYHPLEADRIRRSGIQGPRVDSTPEDASVTHEESSDEDAPTGTGGAATEDIKPETITFESQGTDCEADLYLPNEGVAPWPVLVMANVFGAERRWGVPPFASRFARAGIATLLFDYRYLDGSGGSPRRLIDPERQLADWEAAIAHARSLEAIDEERVGLWGTSFSGGHVLAIGSRRSDLRALVAMVPFVDGRATVAHQVAGRGLTTQLGTMGRVLADRIGAAVGVGPVSLPIVTEPDEGGLVDSPGAKAGFLSLVPDEATVINRTPARVVLDLPTYRPGTRVDEIDTPVHVVVAEADRLLPAEPTERTIERLPDPSVHRVPAGHFDVHLEPWFEPIVDEQVSFLTEALGTAED